MAPPSSHVDIVRSLPSSQADCRTDNQPGLAPTSRPQRPRSASASCRFEHAASVWVQKRLTLKAKQSAVLNQNPKMTNVERSALLKRTYSQPLRAPSHFKRSPSVNKFELYKTETKENRGKSRTNLSSIQAMESRMRKCAECFGYDSAEVQKEATRIVKLASKIAMKSLDKGDAVQALAVLKRAESAGQLYSGLNALTYNNIACSYKRLGHLDGALESVEAALSCYRSGKESARCIALADLQLNYGVILSAMRRHREALPQVRSAVRLLQQELFNEASDDCCRSLLEAVRWTHARHRLGIFPVALYNLAVELEALGHKNRALEAYRMALYFAKHLLGRRHSTTCMLEERYRRYQVLLGSHRPGEMGLRWVCDGITSQERVQTKKMASNSDLISSAIKISLPWSE